MIMDNTKDKVMQVEQDVMLSILGFEKRDIPKSDKYVYTHRQVYGLKIQNNVMCFNSIVKNVRHEIKDISNSAEVLAAMIQCIKEMYREIGANEVRYDIIDILGIDKLIHESISKRIDNEI